MEDIKKILYIGAELNIQVVRDFPNAKEYILTDTQPRSRSDRYYYSDRDYNSKFLDYKIV
jgi:hypothetical protein